MVHQPIRTCVGCRQRGTSEDLIRCVIRAGTVTVDVDRSLPGRGAWVHPQAACVTRAMKRNAFARALRVPEARAYTADLESITESG